MSDPIHDPKAYDPDQPLIIGHVDPRKPSSYLPDLTRAQVIDRLLTALLGALAAILVPWLVPYTRPPAVEMVPEQQEKINDGAKAASAVKSMFGYLPEVGE